MSNPTTTGEWTADKIPACLQSITEHDWNLIANAHNAALAAERNERRIRTAQLAAERELPTHDDLENPPDYSTLRDDYWKLREQLAAEREAVEQYKVAFENANDTCKQLRELLAAAVEALKWYAGATYPDDGSGRPPDAYRKRADAALAKIGEK